jgi:hypothetical protein
MDVKSGLKEFHLPHALLQHDRRWACRAGNSASRRRDDCRFSDGLLADGARRCWPSRYRQGQRRQVSGSAFRTTKGHHRRVTLPCPRDTFQGYALLRSVLKSGSDTDVAKAVNYAKRIKLYALSETAQSEKDSGCIKDIGRHFARSAPLCLWYRKRSRSCAASDWHRNGLGR